MLRSCRLSSKFMIPISGLLSRNYASVAASSVVVTKSKAGVTVVSIEDNAPASSVAVVVKAGSRAESTDNVGVAHFLKNFAFRNTKDKTTFKLTRQAELLGGILSANLTRESLIISSEFLREDLSYFLETLTDVVFKTKYEPYEFRDVKKSVSFERGVAEAIPEVVALDAAHAVAFRHGLGNSLFANATTKVTSSEQVKAFSNKVYTAPNITVVGTSVNHKELVSLTDKLFEKVSHTIPSTPIPSKYFGGEARIATSGSSHFVLGFEGAPIGTSEYTILQVLRAHLDGETHTKWGDGVTPLAQLANKLKDVQISSFNAGYSDAGLFGIYVSGAPTSIYATARAVAEHLKHVFHISKEDFQRAVAKAKYHTAASFDTRASKIELFGGQILYSGRIIPVSDAIEEFDHVTIEDIKNVAEKLLKSTPTTVALGDIGTLPHSDVF
ncbi:Metalloenzyme, LuxS/M16 peptidase-like protein [Glomus cerebriforme]|uniref:Cytochrome b-c1 complex subunit 2, mitochondrial n=1 Tax=Glomus cerebriforme TaxID=658196 RepID=A0A397TMD6_9GLOM|nr:Metalloenzyme, LuxS/M16 peptidase-like protein [Glomus cerebriforme]